MYLRNMCSLPGTSNVETMRSLFEVFFTCTYIMYEHAVFEALDLSSPNRNVEVNVHSSYFYLLPCFLLLLR